MHACAIACVYIGVKFGINFTSCSENGNKIVRSTAKCNLPLSENFTPTHTSYYNSVMTHHSAYDKKLILTGHAKYRLS